MDTKKTAIIILIILILIIGGYFIWNNYFSLSSDVPATTPENQISQEDARDNQRMRDLLYLSEMIDIYAEVHNGQPMVASDWEKISDEESNVFKMLKADNYLEKPLKDPSPDKYYGYRSDGSVYELSAALENKASGKCEISGDLCLYKIQKEGLTYAEDEYFYGE